MITVKLSKSSSVPSLLTGIHLQLRCTSWLKFRTEADNPLKSNGSSVKKCSYVIQSTIYSTERYIKKHKYAESQG